MDVLLMVAVSGVLLVAAYFTVGTWLARRVFRLDDSNTTPAVEINDGADYVPTKKSIIFGHHFTSIAGTGPIVGPAIAVMWGWVPALVWVVVGSIFIGAVHDLGAIVVSLRKKGRSIGDIAGDLLGPRARLIFLGILVMGLWLVLAVFGLVIASVLRQYPGAIFPVVVQTPLAMVIGWVLYRRRVGIAIPSVIALGLMYASVIWGDVPAVHGFNAWMAALPLWVWVVGLLAYAYIASVIPVWALLQPRDYINALQLVTALGLLVVGLGAAGMRSGVAQLSELRQENEEKTQVRDSAVAQLSELRQENEEKTQVRDSAVAQLSELREGEQERTQVGDLRYQGGESAGETYTPRLQLVAPMVDWHPPGAPPLLPILFITVACGACSGFHCLVGSGTTSKQIARERDAKAVGYGSMLTEGFLAVIVIAACAGGIGLGVFNELQYGATLASGNKIYGINTVDLGLNSQGKNRLVVTAFLEADPASAPWLPSPVKSDRALLQTFLYELGEGDLGSYGVTSIANPTVEQVLDSSEVTTTREGAVIEVKPAVVLSDAEGHQWKAIDGGAFRVTADGNALEVVGNRAFTSKYFDWRASSAIGKTVGAFVEGGANFLAALNIPRHIAIALMAVMVASFAATTMDTSCRLQRYVVQELSRVVLIGRRSRHARGSCPGCGYDLTGTDPERALAHNAAEALKRCPECNAVSSAAQRESEGVVAAAMAKASWWNPVKWVTTTHGATMFAVVTAAALAFIPPAGQAWSLANAGMGAMVLWPLFGAVNQLLAGFAFVVIVAWLRMTGRPWWFAVVPGVIMLVVPAWALVWQAFVGNAEAPSWVSAHKWPLVVTAGLALGLEVWLVAEAVVRWRRGSLRGSATL